MPIVGKSGIDRSHCTKQVLVNAEIRNHGGLRCLLPGVSERFFRHISTAHESIGDVLISRTAKFDHDIIHGGGESAVAYEGEPKRRGLFVAVGAKP